MATVPSIPNGLLSVEEALGIPDVARILGVHSRTVERRRAAGKTVRPLEAQREEKLHRIWADLTQLFTVENAIFWLRHPVSALERGRAAGKTVRPLEAQREEKLHRIWADLTQLFTVENAIFWLRHPVSALE